MRLLGGHRQVVAGIVVQDPHQDIVHGQQPVDQLLGAGAETPEQILLDLHKHDRAGSCDGRRRAGEETFLAALDVQLDESHRLQLQGIEAHHGGRVTALPHLGATDVDLAVVVIDGIHLDHAVHIPDRRVEDMDVAQAVQERVAAQLLEDEPLGLESEDHPTRTRQPRQRDRVVAEVGAQIEAEITGPHDLARELEKMRFEVALGQQYFPKRVILQDNETPGAGFDDGGHKGMAAGWRGSTARVTLAERNTAWYCRVTAASLKRWV